MLISTRFAAHSAHQDTQAASDAAGLGAPQARPQQPGQPAGPPLTLTEDPSEREESCTAWILHCSKQSVEPH